MMMRISFNRRVTGSRSRRATRAALAVAAGSWAMVVMGIVPRPPRRFRGVRRVLRCHRTAAGQRTPVGGGGGGGRGRRATRLRAQLTRSEPVVPGGIRGSDQLGVLERQGDLLGGRGRQ